MTSKPDPTPAKKPPPNYASRKVQLKLMLLVGLLVAVVIFATKAADPANYGWWTGGATSDPTGEDGQTLTLDQIPKPKNDLPTLTNMPAVRPLTEFRTVPQISKRRTLDPTTDKEEVLGLTRTDVWRQVRANLDPPQRIALLSSFDFARGGYALSPDQQTKLAEVITKTDEVWDAYLWDAAQALAADNTNAKPWRTILDELLAQWKDSVKPALESLTKPDGAPLVKDDPRRALLDEHQQALDELATSDVKDGMPHHPGEAEAFFRMLYELDSHSAQEINDASVGVVKYLEVDEQADRYRGKIVTINGTARQGTQLVAPKNPYGITKYYRLSIRPMGGPNSPMLVYTLNLPEGMEDLPKNEVVVLRQKVSVTGYFFNKHVYLAKNDILPAPLFLAKAPINLEATAGEEPIGDVPIVFLAGMSVLLVVVSIGIAAGIYNINRPGKNSRDLPNQLTSLPDPDISSNLATGEDIHEVTP